MIGFVRLHVSIKPKTNDAATLKKLTSKAAMSPPPPSFRNLLLHIEPLCGSFRNKITEANIQYVRRCF